MFGGSCRHWDLYLYLAGRPSVPGGLWRESTGSEPPTRTLEDVPRVNGAFFRKAPPGPLRPFGILPEEYDEDTLVLSQDICVPSRRPSGFLSSPFLGRKVSLCLLILIVSIPISILVVLTMGQTVTTPLTLTLDHWTDVRNIAAVQ